MFQNSGSVVLSWDVGVRTLSCCALSAPVVVHHWESIDVHSGSKAKTTLREDAEAVLNALSQRRALWQSLSLHAVIIEQQPAGGHNPFGNVRMKVLSHVIHAYFYQWVQCPVEFVSPSSKLKGMPKKEKGVGRSASYRANKQYAVSRVRELVGDIPTGAKPDDLADAFLLAYVYLTH